MEKSRGLGDDIKKLTRVTQLDRVVNTVVKAVSKITKIEADCGCDARQEKLNEIFPYKDRS